MIAGSSTKERVKAWLKNRNNLILLAIVLFAFIVRVYYLGHTTTQPLWWDEAEYGATAKNYAFDLAYPLNNQRPFAFPWIISLFLLAGVSELSLKFLLVVIPSTLLVGTIYLVGREMFNKKIALIAAFLAAISWTFIFWSIRLQPDSISMVFQMLSIFYMWRYWKNPKTSLIIFAGVFSSLAFNFKVSGLLVPASFFVFILLKDRVSFILKKDYWLFFASFLIVLIPQLIYSYVVFGSFTSFLLNSGYASVVLESKPIGWYTLGFFYSLTDQALFVLFIIGLVFSLKFLLYSDVLIKNKKECFSPHIFSVIVLLVVALFYVFYVRGAEDRWVFLWLPFIFYMAADATIFIASTIMKYQKNLALVFALVVFLLVAYFQLTHANMIIDAKKDSYAPVREAGLWLKENSVSSDKVFSISLPQTAYYSERQTISYSSPRNESDFDRFIELNNPQYLQVSIFEPHPSWLSSWLDSHQALITPVQVYFGDAEKKQPILVIYKFNNGKNN